MRAGTIALGATVACLLVASCADPTEWQPVSPASTTSALPATVDASPSARQPRAAVLPRLPEQGVVVEVGSSVVLVDLDGRVITRLRGFELHYQWTRPGTRRASPRPRRVLRPSRPLPHRPPSGVEG